jgi:hypothetical protein
LAFSELESVSEAAVRVLLLLLAAACWHKLLFRHSTLLLRLGVCVFAIQDFESRSPKLNWKWFA